MAYVLKYSYQFISALGDECEVQFHFQDPANSNHTRLNPGTRPFVLSEYNSDNDIFKPTRAFQAEMQFVSDNATIEDFVFNSADSVLVYFLFNGEYFWKGWLIQDDFQENWIDSNHFITLRATDTLGQINSENLPTLSGKYTIADIYSYCLSNTAIGNSTLTQVWVNNLFYLGMNDRVSGRNTPFNQVSVDSRTFDGMNKLDILETINHSWGISIYQNYTKWWFCRLEEWLNNKVVQGIIRDPSYGAPSFSATFSKTFEVNIGRSELIKPIMPEMIKSMRRPYKYSKIFYNYESFEQIIANQDFRRGSILAGIPNAYTINDWTAYRDYYDRSSPGLFTPYRQIEYDANGKISDEYAVVPTINISPIGYPTFISSQSIFLKKNDIIKFEVDFKLSGNITGDHTDTIAALVFEDITGIKWMLNNDGEWVDTNNFTTTYGLQLRWKLGVREILWKTYSITANALPENGNLYVYLINSFLTVQAHFKNINFTVNDNLSNSGIVGDYDQYTSSENITQNYEEETYLDDADYSYHKGALFFNNALTGDRWYRMDYSSERYTFKRQKAIGNMLLNRRLRRSLQVNMFGNVWIDNGYRKPIWLMNKFIFTEDAPNKKWMIANINEMNFMEATWNADLLEVWDSTDSNDPSNYLPHSFGSIYR